VVKLDEVTLLHGNGGGGHGVALLPLSSGAVGTEEDAEERDKDEDGDGNDGKGSAPSRVRGETSVDKGLEEGDLWRARRVSWGGFGRDYKNTHLNDESDTSTEVSPSSCESICRAHNVLVKECGCPGL
jgi:hypothetical protein